MKFTNIFRSSRPVGGSQTQIVRLPSVEPGMNADAEDYFQAELKRLGPGRHVASLDRSEGPFGMETSVLVGGKKVAQMLRKYDEELGTELSRLKASGAKIEAEILVDSELEVKILIPFPQELIPWLQASPDERDSLQLKASPPVRIKESGKFEEALSALLGSAEEWKGTIRLELAAETSGKYAGKTKILAYVGETQIGAIGARYREQEPHLFELVEKSNPHNIKGSIYVSSFDGEPYASVYP
jgi:hypothetical protein